MSATTDIATEAQDLKQRYEGHVDVEVETIEEQIESLHTQYSVPVAEAARSVENRLQDQAGIDPSDIQQDFDQPDVVPIETIDTDGEWVSVEGEIVELWEANHESIAQTGLIGDDSDVIKFTIWESADAPKVQEGEVVSLRNVVTDEYEGQYSVQVNSTSAIEQSDESFDTDPTDSIQAAIVAIESHSGLIKRCEEADCARVLTNGRCSEHGEMDGEFDLRIKAVLDDGSDVYRAVFDKELTEDLMGFTLEEAKQKAMDALEIQVVEDQVRDELVGQYIEVAVEQAGAYHLVQEFELSGEPEGVEEVVEQASNLTVDKEAIQAALE